MVLTGFIEIRRCPHESRVECPWPAIINFSHSKLKTLFLPICLCFYTQKRRQFFLTIVCVSKFKY